MYTLNKHVADKPDKATTDQILVPEQNVRVELKTVIMSFTYPYLKPKAENE